MTSPPRLSRPPLSVPVAFFYRETSKEKKFTINQRTELKPENCKFIIAPLLNGELFCEALSKKNKRQEEENLEMRFELEDNKLEEKRCVVKSKQRKAWVP